jgi:diguanylate cyclase (GGDEF)-like protein
LFQEAHLPQKAAADRRPIILVVDDDPGWRDLTGAQLGHGFEIISAADGEEGVRLAVEHCPDVILLDVMMPGMSGADVLRALSEIEETKAIPIVFLSALHNVEHRVEGLDAGAVDYVTKGADPRELIARVNAAARTYARHQELARTSGRDNVTGLWRRTQFEERVAHEFTTARGNGTEISVLLVDIDGIAQWNELGGHEITELVMKEVAGTLRAMLRPSDTLFRYGPDEFAVLLTDSDAQTAYRAAERVRDAVRKISIMDRYVSVSIGVSDSTDAEMPEDLITRTEVALFRAKDSGGDSSWRDEDGQRISREPSLTQQLTEREWEVVAGLVKRNTEQEIARRLGISTGTVRSHKARIRRKLIVPTDMRLSDYLKLNFPELVNRISTPA